MSKVVRHCMPNIKRLAPTTDLKTSFVTQMVSEKQQAFLNYDSDLDTLILSFAGTHEETVVHYLDNHIAVLYTPDDLEIVGLQIEVLLPWMKSLLLKKYTREEK